MPEAVAGKPDALMATWGDRYRIAIPPWETAWKHWTTMFAFPAKSGCLIYTANAIEGYRRHLRKVAKTKGVFPIPEAARRLLWFTQKDIVKD